MVALDRGYTAQCSWEKLLGAISSKLYLAIFRVDGVRCVFDGGFDVAKIKRGKEKRKKNVSRILL